MVAVHERKDLNEEAAKDMFVGWRLSGVGGGDEEGRQKLFR